ncbi:GAF domain-containing protein [Pseudanabaena sp. FACHB-1998]|uniref:GAF domain-containing protein n=1 Tax=Pseudanabaena sp. FACHB-1998 TaxID=2692858 RepID=UPI0016806C67|nr:GAF domain-containing protein [Pseudanabaena sp. FACHB-1998]MBD2175894.1 GAF domain-containing protein [Pseudanabaena sp. FACHB-1998]
MNAKTSNIQDQSTYQRLNVSPFDGRLDEPTLLKAAQSALQLQSALLKNSISYAQSVSGRLILKTTLKNTLETLVSTTDAAEGSIFLIDEDGVIQESILARGPVTRDLKDTVITKVLDDGLAGWALRHRQIGIIYDAMMDDRWVQFPDQPYDARSAIAVPLIYGIDAIGIITLTHAEPNHFDDAIATMIQYSTESITAIIVNAQLHAEYRPFGLV